MREGAHARALYAVCGKYEVTTSTAYTYIQVKESAIKERIKGFSIPIDNGAERLPRKALPCPAGQSLGAPAGGLIHRVYRSLSYAIRLI